MSPLSVEQLIRGCGHDYNRIFAGYLALKSGIQPPGAVPLISQELAANAAQPGDVYAGFIKAFGLTTSDVAQGAEGIVQTLVKQFPQPKHRKLTKYIEAADFRENNILGSFEDIAPSGSYFESGVIPNGYVSELESETGQTQRHPTRIIVSYETQRNSTNWVATVPAGILNSLYREESESLYSLLESNPLMSDGNRLFFDDNTYVQGGLNYKTVLSIFRAQKTSVVQHLVGYEPKYLICPSEIEVDLRTELQLTGMNEVEIFSRADVTALYLMADPEFTPTIVRLAIADVPSVTIRPAPGMSRAVGLLGDNDFKFVPVSRYGICRLTPT